MNKTSWWQKSIADTFKLVKSEPGYGLSSKEVEKRKEQYRNVLEEGTKKNPVLMFLNQFTETMVIVLLAATVISGIIGAMIDAITIMAIVIINAVLGFVQEYRAEKSLDEIKKLASPYANVLRAGKRVKIPAEDLVPGDIVFLEAGDKIPADLRLIQSYSLEIEESALTGESVPVEKSAQANLEKDVSIADQRNMAFMGTSITRGNGQGVVIATGMQTVMGEIASLIKESQEAQTPLQQRLDQLGKILIIICLVVCAMVTAMGIYRGEDTLTMFMAGVSLAVAAIPEGLPAIVTVVLALGVQRMSKRNAIVRKLPAVETLGCTTVICSDKTGTLTQNQMTVKRLAIFDKTLDIEGEGYNKSGSFFSAEGKFNPKKDPVFNKILEVALNCNNAAIADSKRKIEIQGDPTEAALLVLAMKGGLEERFEKIREIPFDSERKKMSVIVKKGNHYYIMVKGALDVLMSSCSQVVKEGNDTKLNENNSKYFLDLQEKWASNALRVLAFAYKKIDSKDIHKISDNELESDLTLLGIAGMIDPPRPNVDESVNQCLDAGVVPIMITGDHPITALAIAKQIGITNDNDEVVTGGDIDNLNDKALYRKAMSTRVFARVSPQHKNRIVKVLQERRQVVAMTGDGVNDAPAVKSADIGVAMAISGTEVTKEASSMVLADDNFSTIVVAVHEGRSIYDNIRKFIRYLLGCNIGEVLVMFLAALLAMPLPLLPIQILWVNLVTDGLPAMALGLEPAEPGVMKRKPRSKDEGIFSNGLGKIILLRGIFIAIITLTAFTVGLAYSQMHGIDNLDLARTMAFTTLVFAQLFYVFECRSEKFSPFELGFFKNKFLVIAVSLSVMMHLTVIYYTPLQEIFRTVPLDWWHWGIIIILSGLQFIFRLLTYIIQRVFINRNIYAKIRL
ncbi:P-type Ca(2+)-transport ATPase [Candidatus Syntrophocurvum alkaliphilum]|uniref:P-type Ca(2+) transporter n=1 Tax=Candidatus Syntrophocurvum alkaliphilum TaxID=2293317 RepID=A0A6I6DEI2_9FIRM|nr:calcium-translocating P-type ATPase, SERCA-type [Candidatus Syntrophocurvum alkaliphilum]QGT99626.1 P-type Ca(2+)-transport ATPase [Candidatus Syntrophocurvum alkaliphilum]